MKQKLTILFLLISLGCFSQLRSNQDFGFANAMGGKVGIQSNTSGIPIPNNDLRSYWDYSYGIRSDSTIILVDLNNNPKDTFKLSNIDFTLSEGYIPTKSACTFTMTSENIDDTAFLNKNIIPCIIYPDVDLNHKIFFKIKDNKILSIAIYLKKQTGGALSTIYSLWELPDTATINFTYINQGDLINNSIATSSTGDTLYIKSGIYVENIATYGGLLVNKNIYIIGLGYVEIKATGNNPITISNNGVSSLENIYSNGSSKTVGVVMLGGGTDFYVKNCKIEGGTNSWQFMTANTTHLHFDNSFSFGYFRHYGKWTIYNSLLKPKGATTIQANNSNYSYLINNSICYDGTTACYIPTACDSFTVINSILYNKFINSTTETTNQETLIRNCNFVRNKSLVTNTWVSKSDMIIDSCTFIDNDVTYRSIINLTNLNNIYFTNNIIHIRGSFDFTSKGNNKKIYIQNNITDSVTSFDILNYRKVIISNNTMIGNNTSIYVDADTIICDSVEIYQNYLSDSYNGGIYIGFKDISEPLKIRGALIYNNYVQAPGAHSCFFDYQQYGSRFYNNWAEDGLIGMTAKGWGHDMHTVFDHNLVINCISNGILIKGGRYCSLFNNTIFSNKTETSTLLTLMSTDDFRPDIDTMDCRNATVKNNIISYNGESCNCGTIINIPDTTHINTFDVDTNLIYHQTPDRLYLEKSIFKGLPGLISRNFTYINQLPDFESINLKKFWLNTNFVGCSLDFPYNYVLNINSIWPNEIFTIQNENKQVGLYEYNE